MHMFILTKMVLGGNQRTGPVSVSCGSSSSVSMQVKVDWSIHRFKVIKKTFPCCWKFLYFLVAENFFISFLLKIIKYASQGIYCKSKRDDVGGDGINNQHQSLSGFNEAIKNKGEPNTYKHSQNSLSAITPIVMVDYCVE